MPTKKHPPNNEPCPTCGGPCKITLKEIIPNWEHLKKYHTLHDTLVQQAVDEAVREALMLVYDNMKNATWGYIAVHFPNAIPKDGE